jgi:hypothetical protein
MDCGQEDTKESSQKRESGKQHCCSKVKKALSENEGRREKREAGKVRGPDIVGEDLLFCVGPTKRRPICCEHIGCAETNGGCDSRQGDKHKF